MPIKVTLKTGAVVEVEDREDLAIVLAVDAMTNKDTAPLDMPVAPPEPRPGRAQSGHITDKVREMVFKRRDEGFTQKQIAQAVGVSETSVQRIIAEGRKRPKAEVAHKNGPEPVTKLVLPPSPKGKTEPQLTYDAAAAVENAFEHYNQPVHLKQLKKYMIKGTKEALSSRLGKAAEMGLIQRVRAGYYAPNRYKTRDWEFKAMSKEEAQSQAMPLVKFMTEHPEITERSDLLPAAVKAGINNAPAAVAVRLWAAKAVGYVEGTGHSHRGGKPLKVTEAGLEAAARDDDK